MDYRNWLPGIHPQNYEVIKENVLQLKISFLAGYALIKSFETSYVKSKL